jgi:predicted oxidoreductase
MKKIALNNKIQVSSIIQGMMGFKRENFTPKEVMEMMVHRIDHEVDTFDTAQLYGLGDNEVLIGEALALNPILKQHTTWITKTGIVPKHDEDSIWHYDTRGQSVIKACEESLQKLGLHSIDVFLIHREDPLIHHESVAKALDECVSRGYIKSYGVSNFDPMKFDALNSFTQQPLVTNQIEFSADWFEHIDNGNLDYLQKQKVHPLIWGPLAQNRLMRNDSPEYQPLIECLQSLANKYHTTPEVIALSFVMHHPVQAVPIIGTTKNDRFENLLMSRMIQLDHQDWFKIYISHPKRRLR